MSELGWEEREGREAPCMVWIVGPEWALPTVKHDRSIIKHPVKDYTRVVPN